MKNIILKSLLFTGVFVFALTSCNEDYPERTPSPEVSPDNIGAYFPKTNDAVVEVAQDVNKVTVTVSRKDSVKAASVALKEVDKDNVFTVPEKVEFAAGKKNATIEVSFTGLEPFVQYQVGITLADDAIDPYVQNPNGTTNFLLNITQADWKNYATGTFTSWFFEQSWDQNLQYSETLKKYRLPDLYATGYSYEFKWDGGATIQPVGTLTSGLYVQPSGYVHAKYGMVQTNTSATASSYDAATKTFTFNIKWTVTAGSFGVGDETFKMK